MTRRKNWLVDAAVFSGEVAAALSGTFCLFLPPAVPPGPE
jgi:hypothetical protein